MFLPLNIPAESQELLADLDRDLRESYVNNCIHAIIILGQERTAIKKQDLNKLVNCQSRNLQGPILHDANFRLNQIFGMRLFESADKATPKLILVNSKPEFSKYRKFTDSACQEATVLYFALMDIFAAADDCKNEDELIENLTDSLAISEEVIRNYLDLFVKRNYLNLEKGQEFKNYSWGDRTIAEVDPSAFFEQFLDLVGDTTERDWPDLILRVEKLNRMAYR